VAQHVTEAGAWRCCRSGAADDACSASTTLNVCWHDLVARRGIVRGIPGGMAA